MSKVIYRCDCCNHKIVNDIVLSIPKEYSENFLNTLMTNNGFYPEIDRYVLHKCETGEMGIARLSGIIFDYID